MACGGFFGKVHLRMAVAHRFGGAQLFHTSLSDFRGRHAAAHHHEAVPHKLRLILGGTHTMQLHNSSA
jgi:hypothetical protein